MDVKTVRVVLILAVLLGIQAWALLNVHTDKAVPSVQFDFNWLNGE